MQPEQNGTAAQQHSDQGISRRAFLQGTGGLALGALLAAACGSSGKSGSSGSSGSSSSSTNLPVSTGSKPSTMRMLYAGDQADFAALATVLPKLKQELGIDLAVDNLPYSALTQKAFSELASSSPQHDIYAVDVSWTPTLAPALEPLGPYIDDAKLNTHAPIDLNDFVGKVFYDTCVYNPKETSLHFPDPTAPLDVSNIDKHGFVVTGFPIQGNALIMSYRKDLFDSEQEKASFQAKYGAPLAVPVTWDDFTKVAEHFTRPAQGLYGTTLMAGVGDWDIDDFKTLVGSFGGDGNLISPNFEIDITTPVAIDALTYYQSLIQKYKVTPPGATSASWDTATSLFSAGRTAMTMNYATQSLNSNVKGSIDYAMVPKKTQYAPHFGTWQLAMPKSLEQSRKSWAYMIMSWLTSSQTQIAMLPKQLHPTRTSVYNYAKSSSQLSATLGNFYPILGESLANGVGRVRVKNYAEVTQPIAVGVNNAAGGGDPAAAMKNAATGVKSVLSSMGIKSTIA